MSFRRNKDNANYSTGGFEHLPSGIYQIKIIRCTENEKPANDKPARFEFEFDIAEGDYKDFFTDDYERFSSNSPNAFWRGSFIQQYKGKSAGYMDALINRFEASNRSFRYRDDGGRCFEGFSIMASIQAEQSRFREKLTWKYTVKNTYTPKEVRDRKDFGGNAVMTYEDIYEEPVQQQPTTKSSEPNNYDISDDDIQF